MSEQEEMLIYKTTNILKKDTSMMKLNDIIEELVCIIESKNEVEWKNPSENYVSHLDFLTSLLIIVQIQIDTFWGSANSFADTSLL